MGGAISSSTFVRQLGQIAQSAGDIIRAIRIRCDMRRFICGRARRYKSHASLIEKIPEREAEPRITRPPKAGAKHQVRAPARSIRHRAALGPAVQPRQPGQRQAKNGQRQHAGQSFKAGNVDQENLGHRHPDHHQPRAAQHRGFPCK